jgi:succinate-semialdehyde dehydrogenase
MRYPFPVVQPAACRRRSSLTKEYQHILRKHGAPEDLVQTVRHGSVETTQELMKALDVVIPTDEEIWAA